MNAQRVGIRNRATVKELGLLVPRRRAQERAGTEASFTLVPPETIIPAPPPPYLKPYCPISAGDETGYKMHGSNATMRHSGHEGYFGRST